MKRRSAIMVLLLATLGMAGEPDEPFSPYRTWQDPSVFLQGAAVDLGVAWDPSAMRADFNINTINAYGVTTANATAVQDAAAARGMRVAVRLEQYDPTTFAFRDEDASALVETYAGVLDRLRPAVVPYVVVNMPLDDPRVGGRERQADYAAAAVAKVRQRAPGVPVFVSLFYGWDGGYDVPSYAGSGADGYVLTNYSYPGKRVATAASNTAELLDTHRSERAVDRAVADHPGRPIVVEYGFQTLRFQRGHRPDQTAGLVADRAAKHKAMQATTAFYRTRYPQVIGTMYFGYNIVKEEGSPPRPIDYALTPPPAVPAPGPRRAGA